MGNNPHNFNSEKDNKALDESAELQDLRTVRGPISDERDDLQDRIKNVLGSVTSKDQLNSVITELPYTAETAKTLRESLPDDPAERARILRFATELLVDAMKNDPDKAGKIATLLSQTWKNHVPDAETTRRLVERCEKTIEESDTSKVAVIQPTAFVLGALGQDEFYKKWLHTTTTQSAWRRADLERNTKSYYGSRENQLSAIKRHLEDANRAGLLIRAHDVGLLVQICEELRSEGLPDDHADALNAKELLRQIITVLEEHEQSDILAYIRKNVSL